MIRPVALVVLAVSACAPAGAPPAQSAAPPPPTFVVANSAGLVALDADCRPTGRVVELPDQSAAATPSLHPDRTRIAFALTQPPSPTTGFGSDIFEVKLDGTGLRPLVEHESENVFYASPRYDPKADAVYVHRRAALIQNGQYVGNEDLIQRVDLATGRRATIARDAADPTVSPDGTQIVYVRLRDGLPEGLWTAKLPDGSDARPLLRTPDTFQYLQTPRFAPSGAEIAFSAAGRQTGARGLPHRAHLGIPSDLYVASADGATLTLLGPTGDDVVPTWSPDGTRIAYVGIGTFVIMNVADRSTRVCAQGEQFFFGDPVWVR